MGPISLANLADDLPAVLHSAPCECPVSVPIRVRARYVREKVKDPTVHATAAQRLARNDRPAHAGARTAPSLESALCELWSIEQTSRSRVSRPSDHRSSVGYLQSYRTPATGPANTLDKGERCILERGEAGEDSPSALSPLEVTGPLRSLSSAVAGAQIFNTAASSLGKGASANEFGHASLCCARLRFRPRGSRRGSALHQLQKASADPYPAGTWRAQL